MRKCRNALLREVICFCPRRLLGVCARWMQVRAQAGMLQKAFQVADHAEACGRASAVAELLISPIELLANGLARARERVAQVHTNMVRDIAARTVVSARDSWCGAAVTIPGDLICFVSVLVIVISNQFLGKRESGAGLRLLKVPALDNSGGSVGNGYVQRGLTPWYAYCAAYQREQTTVVVVQTYRGHIKK